MLAILLQGPRTGVRTMFARQGARGRLLIEKLFGRTILVEVSGRVRLPKADLLGTLVDVVPGEANLPGGLVQFFDRRATGSLLLVGVGLPATGPCIGPVA